MELWFTEQQTPDVGITCKTTRTLHTEKTPFQEIAVIETTQFGRLLALDGLVQTTDRDEFVYHEMIAHVPLFTHPHPQKVLVIGGGDGGTIREVIKHTSVEAAELAEIDGRVIEVCKQYFPNISSGFNDPRVKVNVADGIEYVKRAENEYDVIIIDSSEPIGPGAGLFAPEFYRSVYRALKADGLFVAQTESPFYNDDLIRRVFASIREIFPITRLYLASVPTYPSGLWTFTLGSKRYDPLRVDESKIPELGTRYYTPALHKAAFALPKFVADLTR